MSNIHSPADHVLVKCVADGTQTNNQNTASVDTQFFTKALLVLESTTAAASTAQAKLQESADNVTFTDVPSAVTAVIGASQTTKTALLSVNLAKRQRYIRAVNLITGTSSGSNFINLFNPQYAGVAGKQDNVPAFV